MQISTVDVITCVIEPSSHHSIWGEQAKEWEVFRYWRACFSELQNTTYTEGTVLLIFSKDEVRGAHCWWFVQIHRPNCKATNASVLSLHFGQSVYRRLLNSGNQDSAMPLLRCLNKDLVVVLSSLHTNRNKLKESEDFKWNNIGLASLGFVWFCRHAWFRLMISYRLVIRTC